MNLPAARGHVAIDLGATSGRAIVGWMESNENRLQIEEVHRFSHQMCPTPAGPIWDLTGLWLSLLEGLRRAVSWSGENQVTLQSVGVDTWGVDWVLVGRSGELLQWAHCYRDPLHATVSDEIINELNGFEHLYARNGLQFLPFNTLFQYAARCRREPSVFRAAKRLLFLPDLFHYWLSGEFSTERTIASTSAMLHAHSNHWDYELLQQLELPTNVLGELSEPGTTLGSLRDEICDWTGASRSLQVVLPPGHDTAAAIVAVPAASDDDKWAYLSSGTWSLLGAEIAKPVLTAEARAAPFTNERGVGNTTRFLKNIAGLWLLEELRRDLGRREEMHDWESILTRAKDAEPFRTLVDPNRAEFGLPGAMIQKLTTVAATTNQPIPETTGQLARCCLDSLALCYLSTLQELERVLNRSFQRLHIVGGGSRNGLLNQWTANAIGKPVICGPIEATAIGNLLVQSLGEAATPTAVREIVRRSFSTSCLEPEPSEAAAHLERFERLCTEE